MELLLVRHGEADPSAAAQDPSLSALGRQQADLVAADLPTPTALYSSRLARARETAAAVGLAHGLEAQVLDGVEEFDADGDYVQFDALREAGDPRYLACLKGDLSPWGTDAAAFTARTTAALDAVAARHPGGRVVVVTHGGVLNAYLGGVLGVPRLWFHRPAHTGVSTVRVDDRGRRALVTLNAFGHLRALPIVEH